jgi:hypothetical protein
MNGPIAFLPASEGLEGAAARRMKPPSGNDGALREGEAHATVKGSAGNIDIHSHEASELQPLGLVGFIGGIKVNFIEKQ